MHIVNALAPIMMLILLGAVLRRAGFLKPSFFHDVNPLIYWIALPCLLFRETASADVQLGEAMKVAGLIISGTAGAALLGWAAALVLRLPGPSAGSFVQGSFRGNYVYVGLPVILYGLAGSAAAAGADYESLVYIAIAPLVPLNNAAAVFVLVAGRNRGQGGRMGGGKVALEVLANPLIISIAAGAAFSMSGLVLPVFADAALKLSGQIALPLALFSTGAAISLSEVRGKLGHAAAASIVKVAAAPAIGWLLAYAAGYSGSGMKIGVLLLACPTSVVSFVMAEQLGADHRLAASIVAVSTAMSMVSLALVLALV